MFSVRRSWGKPAGYRSANADEVLAAARRVGASPYAIDVCTLSLETRRGLWVAQPPIKPKGISKKKRTIQAVEFRYYTEAEGRFMQMLTKKDDDDQPSILH